MMQIGAQWFLTKTGLAASSHLESGGFARSSPEVSFFLNLFWIFLVVFPRIGSLSSHVIVDHFNSYLFVELIIT